MSGLSMFDGSNDCYFHSGTVHASGKPLHLCRHASCLFIFLAILILISQSDVTSVICLRMIFLCYLDINFFLIYFISAFRMPNCQCVLIFNANVLSWALYIPPSKTSLLFTPQMPPPPICSLNPSLTMIGTNW